MNRLQELINGAEEIINKPVFNDCADHVGTTVELGWIRGVYSFLKSQPNVVLCKDCIKRREWFCELDGKYHSPNFFCGFGKPKDGDGDAVD